MIIAVEKGLQNIKTNLSSCGYDVVDLENLTTSVDAIVYKSVHLNADNMLHFTNSSNPNGILMIYANNKSFDEIDNILKTRVYSPLF